MRPGCTTAPGRRTASPLQSVRLAVCVRPANIAARGRVRCRSGSQTAPTTPGDVRGANGVMGNHVRAMIPGRSTAVPLRGTETRVVQTIVRPTGRQCRGDPVGRPFGAPRALGPRWLVRGRCAQRCQGCQGDAPRRPYITCVQPRVLGQRTWHRDGRVRCRGGSRTAPYNTPCCIGSRDGIAWQRGRPPDVTHPP